MSWRPSFFRLLASTLLASAITLITSVSWADKIAVLPFTSPKNVPKPELDEVRRWTREAVTKQNHTYASDNEMVSAEATIKDGAADTSQEYVAAGKAVGAQWTLTGRVERNDYPPSKLPDGKEEEGYTTYRVEIEAAQVNTGRVESLSREVLPEEGPSDIAQMLALLVRPEGIANAEIPWERIGVRKPKRTPKPPPPKPVEPPPPPKPVEPPAPRHVYGEGHPVAIGLSMGVTNALVRPDQARGPSWAIPIGATIGYAFPEQAPGLEAKANLTSQVVGPRALEISIGGRYALAPLRGIKIFVGPELLLGTHIALGADKAARFLLHGSAFLAVGITANIQAEVAGDIAPAFGGNGTIVLGGGTARFVVRF
jgi:hypothetical protein